MRYHKRCEVLRYGQSAGLLGDDEVLIGREQLPCAILALTMSENIGVFGQYRAVAFKVFFQGVPAVFKRLEYEGVVYDVVVSKLHRRGLVVIVA